MTTRAVPAALATALGGKYTIEFMAVHLDFPGDPLYAANTSTDVVIDGDTYTAVGDLAGVGALHEDQSLRPNDLTLTLGMLDSTILGYFRAEAHVNRTAVVHLCARDLITGQLAESLEIYRGSMDVMTANTNEGARSVTLTLSDERNIFDLSLGNFWSHAWHGELTKTQARPNGSKLFSRVHLWESTDIEWGDAGVGLGRSSNQGDGGGGGRVNIHFGR